MSTDITFGSLNVHRADCNKDHYHPCRDWDDDRGDELAKWIKDEMRSSVYAWQECMPEQAVDITDYLGWGDAQNPAYWWDENQNVVACDRDKWTDLAVYHISLGKVGSKADDHRRSILWVLLEHLDSGLRCWFGSGHLENGDGDERAREAQVLVDYLPPGDEPFVFGIDRNSYTTSSGGPRDIFKKAGLTELSYDNPDDQRSFNQWDHSKEPKDGNSIDAQHYTGLKIRDGSEMLYTTKKDTTDHNGLVGRYTLP